MSAASVRTAPGDSGGIEGRRTRPCAWTTCAPPAEPAPEAARPLPTSNQPAPAAP